MLLCQMRDINEKVGKYLCPKQAKLIRQALLGLQEKVVQQRVGNSWESVFTVLAAIPRKILYENELKYYTINPLKKWIKKGNF